MAQSSRSTGSRSHLLPAADGLAILTRIPAANVARSCGACKTGTVDSRDAVAERTGRYSQRVPVLQAPQPLIRLQAPVSRVSGVIGHANYRSVRRTRQRGGQSKAGRSSIRTRPCGFHRPAGYAAGDARRRGPGRSSPDHAPCAPCHRPCPCDSPEPHPAR
jgi:hypothetical protein